MDTIRIRNLKFDAYLGVYDWEQKEPRPVSVTLELGVDLCDSCHTDDIDDTVDYALLSMCIITICGAKKDSPRRYSLIEAMAEEIAESAFDFDERIEKVKVTVCKPGAVPEADAVEVEIERERENESN